MKSPLIIISFLLPLILSCASTELPEPQRYDYSTSGALTDDCFQILITYPPDKGLNTMADQRENSYIKAMNSINVEIEKQFIAYFASSMSIDPSALDSEKIALLKKKAGSYFGKGKVTQEYYLIDNSAVLVYRIYSTGIKNDILGN